MEIVRPVVDADLVEQVKKKFSEVKGLSATGVVDWALRYLLKLNDVYMKERKEANK